MSALGVLLMLAGVPSVDDLGWLAGAWRTEPQITANGAKWTEELWTEPAFGSVLGVGRSVAGQATRSFDFMRIATDEKGLAFYGSPQGAPAVRFDAVEVGAGRVVFVNPRHDYPQRISYARFGDTLTATISLMDGSKRVSWTYKRR
jgi:hypothetical protein